MALETLKGLPPLGVMPWRHWAQKRANDLKAAIKRFVAAGENPKSEWLRELGLLSLDGVMPDAADDEDEDAEASIARAVAKQGW